MAFDVLHEGHIRLLETAKQHGHVVVGLLTDAAISSVKRFPHLPVSQRKTIAQQLRLVDSVVMQDTYDCKANLQWLKPDVVVHIATTGQAETVVRSDKTSSAPYRSGTESLSRHHTTLLFPPVIFGTSFGPWVQLPSCGWRDSTES